MIAAGAIVASACSTVLDSNDQPLQGDSPEVTAGTNGVVDVSLTDLRVTPEILIVRPGTTVTFNVTNDGVIFHELRFTNKAGIEEHLEEAHATPEGNHDDVDEALGEGHEEDEYHDLVLELDPGESGTITVEFSEDTSIYTEAACLVPGHYESGMTAELVYA